MQAFGAVFALRMKVSLQVSCRWVRPKLWWQLSLVPGTMFPIVSLDAGIVAPQIMADLGLGRNFIYLELEFNCSSSLVLFSLHVSCYKMNVSLNFVGEECMKAEYIRGI